MPTESRMHSERSRLSKANQEDVDVATSRAGLLTAASVQRVGLLTKVTGNIDRLIAFVVGYAQDEAPAEALEVRS